MRFLSGLSQKQTYAHNLRAVFELARLHGPLTIAEMAQHTGLTVQTMSNVVGRLEQEGFVHSIGRKEAKRGQPPKQYAVNDEALCSVGVHLERGYFSVLLSDLSGRVLRWESAALVSAEPELALKEIGQAVSALAATAPAPVVGVGLALPGPLSLVEGRVRSVPNYPGWDDVPVGQLLRDATSMPVLIENDATAAAIGVMRHGRGRDCGDFFYIYFGTNLGGGIISDSTALRGATANAGEFGRLLVGQVDGAEVNDVVSFAALREIYPGIDREEMARRFLAGEDRLLAWLEAATDALLGPLHAVEHLLDPEKIILGGQFPDAVVEWMARSLNDKVAARRRPESVTAPTIEASLNQGRAAAQGAAALPILNALSPDSLFWRVASDIAPMPAARPAFWA
jgi:predicted NBD/HSP70 family sugar kinase